MNLTTRVDKLWEVFGDSQLLFGGATIGANLSNLITYVVLHIGE
jgi:hypothetical protein